MIFVIPLILACVRGVSGWNCFWGDQNNKSLLEIRIVDKGRQVFYRLILNKNGVEFYDDREI